MSGNVIGFGIVLLTLGAIVAFLLITSKSKGVGKAKGSGGGITPSPEDNKITAPKEEIPGSNQKD